MENMAHIASRVLNTPLLLEPGYARTFFSALAPRLGVGELCDSEGQILTGEKMRQSAASWGGSSQLQVAGDSVTRTRLNKWGEEELIYHVVRGVAILPVKGTLVHKFGYLNPTSGMTGYDSIIERASLAFADDAVLGVLLDNDTPGGEVSGCFDASRALRVMADRVGKKLWSLCYDMNCSAGMALASSAHQRLITQTGVAGSVGVVMAHADMSQKLEQDGVKVTLIHSGARKVDGNPYEALPGDVLAAFQAESDQLRNEFAQIVSTHIGMSVEDILATEAAVYRGQSAVDVGFADELVNGIDAVSIFSEHLSSQGRTITLGANMSKEDVTTQAETPEKPSPAAGEQEGEVAASTETKPESAEESTPDAAADMQARIAGILQCEEAKGREATANHLAFYTSMTVEQAKEVLATVEVSEADPADMGNALNTAMQNEDRPEVGVDAQGDAEVNPLLASYEKVTGDK